MGGALTLTGTAHTHAGDYPSDAWTFSGGTNYNDASGTVHDTIAKANATVTVNGYTGVYDAATVQPVGTCRMFTVTNPGPVTSAAVTRCR